MVSCHHGNNNASSSSGDVAVVEKTKIVPEHRDARHSSFRCFYRCCACFGATGGGKYASGEYREGKTLMYVNRGIGTTIIPARLFCRPELTLFKLHA